MYFYLWLVVEIALMSESVASFDSHTAQDSLVSVTVPVTGESIDVGMKIDYLPDQSNILSLDEISSIIEGVYSIAAPSQTSDVLMSFPSSSAAANVNKNLTATCADQYCDMLVTALSCKAIGINLRKVLLQLNLLNIYWDYGRDEM